MTDLADIGVNDAKLWANKLIAANYRGPGDTVEAAIHRAAVKHGIDPKALWRLRYRTPKDLLFSTWARIKQAHDAECERQEARLRHEIEITKALTTSKTALAAIRAAEAVLAASESETERPSAQ